MKFASYTIDNISELDLSAINLTHIGVEKLTNGTNSFELNGKTVQLGTAGRWEISYKYLKDITNIAIGNNQILYIEYEEGGKS